MNITVVAVGKIKEKYFSDGVKEYEKRLSRYGKVEILEVADEKTPDGAFPAEEDRIREKEGERILARLRDDAYTVALAIDGQMLSSEELADFIGRKGVEGISRLQFIIGGSLGLSGAVLRRADMRLSFSKMTFPHQLMRVILLEQIYRGFRILNHEPYHK